MTSWLKRYLTFVHVSRFLLSFALAFALWAWVTNERDPEETYNARGVPVTTVGLNEQFVATLSEQTVDVTLRGPRSVTNDVDTAAITASVNLESVTEPGTVRREVDIDYPDGLRSADSDPEALDIVVALVTEKPFDVVVELPQNLAANLRVTNTAASPATVTARGVADDINQIAQVVAQPQIQGETASFTAIAPLVAVNAQNQRIDGITFEPPTVEVDLQLEVRGKEIPVFVRCDACDAAEGYEVLGQPQASPTTVLIDGPPELLDQVQYIYTTPIATDTLTEPTVLGGILLDIAALPDGVTVEPTTVDVSVRVEQAVFSQTFANVSVTIVGAPNELRVTVNPIAIEVTLQGRSADLANVREEDIYVFVDVAGLAPGAHQVEPRVGLPQGVTYVGPLPDILVQVTAPASPTPQPTATDPPPATVEPEATQLMPGAAVTPTP